MGTPSPRFCLPSLFPLKSVWLGRESSLSLTHSNHHTLHVPSGLFRCLSHHFPLFPILCLQLVYDGIPKGDLQQRELQLSVLSEQGFWENVLLGEVHIRLRELDLAQEKTGWFALGSRSHETL